MEAAAAEAEVGEAGMVSETLRVEAVWRAGAAAGRRYHELAPARVAVGVKAKGGPVASASAQATNEGRLAGREWIAVGILAEIRCTTARARRFPWEVARQVRSRCPGLVAQVGTPVEAKPPRGC